jgi:hypothetical protein
MLLMENGYLKLQSQHEMLNILLNLMRKILKNLVETVADEVEENLLP